MISSWIHPVGWALVHSVWQILALASVYRAVEPLLRTRPRAAHALGLSLLILSVGLFAGTVSLQRSPAAFRSVVEAPPPAAPAVAVAPGAARSLGITGETPSSPTADLIAARSEQLLGPAVLLWLIGACLVGRGFATAYRRSRRLGESSTAVSSVALLESVESCRRELGLRRRVEVVVSPEADSPLIVGWLKPRLVLPTGLTELLTAQQMRSVLAHEIAHVRRWDYPANLLQSSIERVFFFHPAMHWLSRRIRVAREHCCDDLAARASRDGAVGYARSLLRLEEARRTPSVALRATDGDLMRRIERLLARQEGSVENDNAEHRRTHRPSRATMFLRLTSPLGAAAVAIGLALGGVWSLEASIAARTVVDGLDPTHLVEGREVRGLPDLSAHSGGYRYLFETAERRSAFLENPGRFVVSNVEACPITGRDVRPDAWQVIDGRIYLLCCPGPPEEALLQAVARLDRIEP